MPLPRKNKLPRQWVYLFQRRFVPLVKDEDKLRTMRPKRKDGKRPQPGDRISLRHWAGLPYRSFQTIIHNSTVKAVSDVVIKQHFTPFVNGSSLSLEEAEDFARYDGFKDYRDMLEWFQHEHGEKVELDMIEWHTKQ